MIIRDAIHGDLSLSNEEASIFDTPEVQRLRGIKQLGASYYVYPCATHTRFEHSLGAAHCAQKMMDHLQSQVAIPPDLQQVIRIAAILHDISHIPFGHTFEDERKLMPRHDKGNRFNLLTTNTKLGFALEKLKIKDQVTAIVENKQHPDVPQWAKQIVSSTIDADLLDYLRRDNYFTGLSQSYDNRIFSSFVIQDEELGIHMVKKGLDRQDTLTEVMNLLRLRYFLTERVYYHHTKVIVGSMISKALESVLTSGLDENELLSYNDGSFFAFLMNQNAQTKILLNRVNQRDLFKRAYVLSYANSPEGVPQRLINEFSADIHKRNEAEKSIALSASIAPENVIMYCSSLPTNKEAEVKVLSSNGWHPFNAIGKLKTYQEIASLDTKFNQLWKLFILCPEEHISAVAKASEKFFEVKNEYLSF